MDEQEKQERARQLREEMRVERGQHNVGTDNGGSITFKGSRSTSNKIRSISKDARTDTSEASRDSGEARSNNRSAQVSSKRDRQDSRRLEHGHSELADRSSQVRRVGLERADSEPTINGNLRHVGTRAKEQVQSVASSVKDAIFAKKGSVLTKKEADEYYEPLKAAILDSGDSLDKLLGWKTGYAVEIWGNISDFEAESLAKIMIKRGLENAYAAATVRRFVDMKDYISVGVMFLPRIQMTVEVLRISNKEKHETKDK